MKQNEKEVVELEAGEGDIIIADREPYVIDDEKLLELIIAKREKLESFEYQGKKVTVVEYIKGQVLSKTLVRIEDAK
jgi:hypothetical protein